MYNVKDLDSPIPIISDQIFTYQIDTIFILIRDTWKWWKLLKKKKDQNVLCACVTHITFSIHTIANTRFLSYWIFCSDIARSLGVAPATVSYTTMGVAPNIISRTAAKLHTAWLRDDGHLFANFAFVNPHLFHKKQQVHRPMITMFFLPTYT